VVRIAPERQAQKLIVSSKPAQAATAPAPAGDRVATPTG
jgi:hypothetical protein